MAGSESQLVEPPWRLVPLGPDDDDRFCDHLMRLDDEDLRLRFFVRPPDFVVALHAGAAVSDGRIVRACESEGAIRGVGELAADPSRTGVGELAFSVERDWRRRGLGSALMRAMIDAAWDAGFQRLELEILPDNPTMQALARRFVTRLEQRDGNIVAAIERPSDL